MTHEYGVMSFISCKCISDGEPGSCPDCEAPLPGGDGPLGKPITGNIDGDPRDEFILYREAGTALHVYDTVGVPETSETPATINPVDVPQTISLPEGWSLGPQVPLLAQFDGEGGLDLLMQVMIGDDPMPYVAVSYNTAGN